MITGLLILIPLLGSALVMFTGADRSVRRNSIIVAVIELLLSIAALASFSNSGQPELAIYVPWLKGAGVSFDFAMDGLSLLMVLLTTFLFVIIIISSSGFQSRRLNIFHGSLLILEAALIGVFTAQDGIIFYVFWELALIPAYFLTALWGGKDRIRITFKFFIYTMTGSLLMLGALIWLYLQTPEPHSGSITALYQVATTSKNQILIFAALFFAFAVKIPIFPFHTWQPDTYTESPAAGSMVLAGVMMKMGIYGIIRFLIPLCRDALTSLQAVCVIIIVIGIIYASVIALRQTDLKRFIAWVSIAHAGLISAGALSLNHLAMQGAVVQMLAHGINVVALFIITDIIQNRYGSRSMDELGGIARSNPLLGILTMIILLGTIAMPLTNGFAGEFMLLAGLYRYNPVIAGLAGTTIIFSAVYMLRMYQKVMFGNKDLIIADDRKKLTLPELITLIPLAALVFVIGIFPQPVITLAEPAVKTILDFINVIPK